MTNRQSVAARLKSCPDTKTGAVQLLGMTNLQSIAARLKSCPDTKTGAV
jgi:hypothetical protein